MKTLAQDTGDITMVTHYNMNTYYKEENLEKMDRHNQLWSKILNTK